MFGKLLKYDMRAIGRSFWIIALSMLGISVAGGAAMRFINEYSSNTASDLPGIFALIYVGAILFLIICFSALILSLTVTEILLIARFYKNFFTDEGYLTFTLPVTRRQLLFSKFLNALIWLSLHALLLIASFAILITIGIVGVDMSASPFFFTVTFFGTTLSVTFSEFMSQLWNTLGGWLIVFAIEILLLALSAIVYMVTVIYFAFTLGSVCAKKNKILASIGIWYLISMIVYIIFFILLIFGIIACGIGLIPMLSVATPGTVAAVIALLIALVITAIVTLSTIFYHITLDKLERRLNLA